MPNHQLSHAKYQFCDSSNERLMFRSDNKNCGQKSTVQQSFRTRGTIHWLNCCWVWVFAQAHTHRNQQFKMSSSVVDQTTTDDYFGGTIWVILCVFQIGNKLQHSCALHRNLHNETWRWINKCYLMNCLDYFHSKVDFEKFQSYSNGFFYKIFKQFYRILRQFCRVLRKFYRILMQFYRILMQFYSSSFAEFSNFILTKKEVPVSCSWVSLVLL